MEANELVVESMKHCFVCLDKIKSQNAFSVDSKQERELPKCSLLSLSSYLKMDIGKVFSDNDSIPHDLLDKVRKAKLKGELCDECLLMNDKFSVLYRKLIKIKMEVVSSIQQFHNKFLEANNAERPEGLRHLASSMVNSSGGWMGKLDILEVLRTEAIQKCSLKLSGDNARPCVKVQNLTTHQLINKRRKFKRNSTLEVGQNSMFNAVSNPEVELRSSKTEHLDDQVLDENEDCSDYQEMDASYANESNLAAINRGEYEGRPTAHPSIQPEFGKATQNRGDESNNPKHLFVVIIPPESVNVEKPQSSLNPITGKYKCNLCPKEFSNKAAFKAHYDSVHLKVKYKCTVCGSQFTQRSQFNVHHRSIHMGIRLKCLGCNRIFKQKTQLTKHQRKCCGRTTTVTKTEFT